MANPQSKSPVSPDRSLLALALPFSYPGYHGNAGIPPRLGEPQLTCEQIDMTFLALLTSPPEIPVAESLDRPGVVGTLEEAGSPVLSDSQLIGQIGEGVGRNIRG